MTVWVLGDATGSRVGILGEPALEGSLWARIDLPGWPAHTCEVNVALIDGEPRVIGLRITPVGADQAPADATISDQIITRARVAAFPIQRAAAAVAAVFAGDVGQKLADLAAAPPGDPRRATTVEQVAAIYRQAQVAGLAPRKAVMDQLAISSRTATRYISAARRSGLLPPYRAQTKGDTSE